MVLRGLRWNVDAWVGLERVEVLSRRGSLPGRTLESAVGGKKRDERQRGEA